MALKPVHCRICKKEIDREKESGWIMPSRNYFYHKDCYDNWVNKKDNLSAQGSDEEWYEALIYYLSHIIKASVDYKKVKSQWKNFLKQNKTAKGIYFSIKYFYEVQRGDKEKALGGIGIVTSIYEDSCAYWYEREDKDHGLCERIEKQMREQMENESVVVKQNTRKKTQVKTYSIEDILKMEEECL